MVPGVYDVKEVGYTGDFADIEDLFYQCFNGFSAGSCNTLSQTQQINVKVGSSSTVSNIAYFRNKPYEADVTIEKKYDVPDKTAGGTGEAELEASEVSLNSILPSNSFGIRSKTFVTKYPGLLSQLGIENYFNGNPLSTMTINYDEETKKYEGRSEQFGFINEPSITYQLAETKVGPGTKFKSIENNGIVTFAKGTDDVYHSTSSLKVINTIQSRKIKIVKKDKITDKVIKQKGFKFQILKAKYENDETQNSKIVGFEPVTNTEGKSEFETDSNGEIDFGRLAYGTYFLKETKAVDPYELDDATRYFTVYEDGYTPPASEEYISKTYEKADANYDNPEEIILTAKDLPHVGSIQLTKIANQVSDSAIGANVTGSSISVMETKWHPTSIDTQEGTLSTGDYDIGWSKVTLSDTTYGIYAAENIIVNGEVICKKNQLYKSVTTKEDGSIQQDGIPVGKWYLKEMDCPEGFTVDPNPHPFEIAYETKSTQPTVRKLTMEDDHQDGIVKIKKLMEFNQFASKEKDAYKDVVFGLYAAKDITYSDGRVAVPKGSLLSTTKLEPVLVKSQKGNYYEYEGTFNEKLPYGDYMVKEISTNKYYDQDSTSYPVVYNYETAHNKNDKTVDLYVNATNGGYVINKLKKMGMITAEMPKFPPTMISKSKGNIPLKYKNPKTGDNINLIFLSIVFVVSGGIVLALFLYKKRKKFKKGIKTGSLLLLMAALLVPMTISNMLVHAQAGFTETKRYETFDKKDLGSWPETTTKNGITYKCQVKSEKIMEAVPVQPEKIEVKKTATKLLKKEWSVPKSIQVKNKQNVLLEASLKGISYTATKTPVDVMVSQTLSYPKQLNAKKPAFSKTIDVKQKSQFNEDNLEAKCGVKSVTTSKSYWVEDCYFPITVKAYGSKYFVFGNNLIESDIASNAIDLNNKDGKNAVMNYLNLDKKIYQIVNIDWDGAPYSKKGVKYRKARASVKRLVQDYNINYQGTVQDQKPTWNAEATYEAIDLPESGRDVKYVKEITLTYTPVNDVPKGTGFSTLQKVLISIGICVLAAGVILFLYLLQKRKKKVATSQQEGVQKE